MRRMLLSALCLCCLLSACRKAAPPAPGAPTGAAAGNPSIGGAAQGVRGAVNRTVTLNALNNLRLFIDTYSGANGKMPNKAQVLEAAKQDRELVEALNDGRIIVTETKSRDGVWAYEAEALKTNGQVITAVGIERMNADQLKQRLQSGS